MSGAACVPLSARLQFNVARVASFLPKESGWVGFRNLAPPKGPPTDGIPVLLTPFSDAMRLCPKQLRGALDVAKVEDWWAHRSLVVVVSP